MLQVQNNRDTLVFSDKLVWQYLTLWGVKEPLFRGKNYLAVTTPNVCAVLGHGWVICRDRSLQQPKWVSYLAIVSSSKQ